ncbi:hypothetical protein HMPREF1631_06790 [Arcanobacterium sp. S3PF19]|nr:hypothetical protein HMPREF1631_06790 [Arcanobacterium sp. S3PF19]
MCKTAKSPKYFEPLRARYPRRRVKNGSGNRSRKPKTAVFRLLRARQAVACIARLSTSVRHIPDYPRFSFPCGKIRFQMMK